MVPELKILRDRLHDQGEAQLQLCNYLQDLEEMFSKAPSPEDWQLLKRAVKAFEDSRFKCATALNRCMMRLDPFYDNYAHDM